MKKIFSLICLIIGLSASAQVGVGTTTPNARLDVAAADPSNPTNLDGLIIPRVQSLPTGMTANQNGMLTYKTVASTGSPIGMYIYFHPTGWAYVNSDFTITPDLWTKTGTVISPATAGDDLEFNNSNSSIEFPAVSTSAPPMIKMFSSGTSNATRMVIAHSDGFSSFGLRYTDAGDYFSITGSGETIRLNTFGTNPLTVFGSATFGTSGNQYTLPAADGNAGEVITTDGSGNTNWSSTSAFTNPQFPDGFRNATPLTRNDTQGTYTVPSGRNFYITAFYKRTGTTSLRVNGVQIINDLGTRNDGNLENPIIVGSGQVLSLSAIIINGFLVDANVTPITTNAPYNVPTGKSFVLLNFNQNSINELGIYIDNQRTAQSAPTNGGNSTASPLNLPLFANTRVSNQFGTNFQINGYLFDE